MTTIPHQRRGPGAGWLVPAGLVVLAAGIAALIGTGDEDVVNWIKDNTTCNEQPCTYEEAKGILTAIGVAGTIAGALMMLAGAWRVLRTRDAGPSLPAPSEPPTDHGPLDAGPVSIEERDEPFAADREARAETQFGFRDKRQGDTPADRLARLDELLAEGKLDSGDYMKLRERILRDM